MTLIGKNNSTESIASTQALEQCPPALAHLDAHAAHRWPIFLRKTGLVISARTGAVIDTEGRRAWTVRNFGIPSLVQRLPSARTETDRARLWWRESVACSEGAEIPDLSAANIHLLNPFLVGEKFPDPRAHNLRRRGRPSKPDDEKLARHAARSRAYRARRSGRSVTRKEVSATNTEVSRIQAVIGQNDEQTVTFAKPDRGSGIKRHAGPVESISYRPKNPSHGFSAPRSGQEVRA